MIGVAKAAMGKDKCCATEILNEQNVFNSTEGNQVIKGLVKIEAQKYNMLYELQ